MEATELKAGDVVAEEYRLVRLIGEGGMAQVWEGEHTEIGRRVAIKVMLPGLMTRQDAVARFLREGKLAASIRHENIVDVIRVGKLPDDRPFLVMEYVEGETLAKMIERCRGLPWSVTQLVMYQVCEALIAAHAKDIVHRDLKPENIIIGRRTGNPCFVKVLDFGIARVLGENATRLTATGESVGTVAYMAPEQAMDKDPNHRVDVYAIGVIIHEMLTGKALFQGTAAQILAKALNPAHQLPLMTDCRPNWPIPQSVQPVVSRALQRDPADRYQTMTDLLKAIMACAVEDETPIVRTDSGDAVGTGGGPSVSIETHLPSVQIRITDGVPVVSARDSTFFRAPGPRPHEEKAIQLERPATARPAQARSSQSVHHEPAVDNSNAALAAVGIILILLAVVFAGWWFFIRPSANPPSAPAVEAPTEEAAQPAPEPPVPTQPAPLDSVRGVPALSPPPAPSPAPLAPKKRPSLKEMSSDGDADSAPSRRTDHPVSPAPRPAKPRAGGGDLREPAWK